MAKRPQAAKKAKDIQKENIYGKIHTTNAIDVGYPCSCNNVNSQKRGRSVVFFVKTRTCIS